MAELQAQAPAPFDVLADTYDEVFTRSRIGRAQRLQVWRLCEQVFSRGQRVLEINCGTGEDALFLTRRGVNVVACDSSARMIDVARVRKRVELPEANVEFHRLPTEQLNRLSTERFDGALSNFGGLNCVEGLGRVAADLARMLKSKSPLVLCLANRTCAWEIVWYGLHGDQAKALRRMQRGGVEASLGSARVHVWYPKVNDLERTFAPWFQLKEYRSVGTCVPPSYLEHWIGRHEALLHICERLDQSISGWKFFRSIGDHVLLHFERHGGEEA